MLIQLKRARFAYNLVPFYLFLFFSLLFDRPRRCASSCGICISLKSLNEIGYENLLNRFFDVLLCVTLVDKTMIWRNQNKKIIPHMIFPYKRTTLHQIEWHSILMFNIYCLQSFLLSTLCFFFVFVIWIFFFNSIVNPKVQQNGSESVPFQSV